MTALIEFLRALLIALPTVFVVVDPFAAIPIFVAITARDPVAERTRLAARAAFAAALALAFFALVGRPLFGVLGISIGAFKVAAGLMTLLMAVDMMRAEPSRTRSTIAEQSESAERNDVAVVPLAIPMLAGPGAIATVVVLTQQARGRPHAIAAVLVAIGVTGLASWILLRAAALAGGFISGTMLRVLERVMGLLLAAAAVEFVVGGLADLLPRLLARS